MRLRDYLFENDIAAIGGRRSRAAAVAGNQYVIAIVRVVLGAVFIYAALQKIGKPLMFADEIRMYHVLERGPLLYTVAIALPWIELFCGLSLLAGVFLRGTALILAALNAVFLAMITWRTVGVMNAEGTPLMKIYFDCGCGFGATYAWKKLIEDSAFILMAAAIYFSPAFRFTPARRWKG